MSLRGVIKRLAIWPQKYGTRKRPERSLEAEVAQTSRDQRTAKMATELGNVLADQFPALAEHLQQGFSSTSQVRLFTYTRRCGKDPGWSWSREPPNFRGKSNCHLFAILGDG